MPKNKPSWSPRPPDWPHLAALLQSSNPWSNWMGPSTPMFGSMRMAALMLRDVPVPEMVNRLAPAILDAYAVLEATLVKEIKRGSLAGLLSISFTDWLETDWHSCRSLPIRVVEHILPGMGTTADADFFARTLERSSDYDSEDLLYLLMNGIQHWSFDTDDRSGVEPQSRWLTEIEPCDGQDGLGALYAHLYKKFAAGGHIDCDPLPLELDTVTDAERTLYFDESVGAGSEEMMEMTMRVAVQDGQPLLPAILGIDSRMWRERAALFQKVESRHKRKAQQ